MPSDPGDPLSIPAFVLVLESRCYPLQLPEHLHEEGSGLQQIFSGRLLVIEDLVSAGEGAHQVGFYQHSVLNKLHDVMSCEERCRYVALADTTWNLNLQFLYCMTII